MSQAKFLTNNATMHIRANGDVLIKRRTLLYGAGLFAGLLLALGGLGILITGLTDFDLAGLLFGALIALGSYFVVRAAWRGLREPEILIEKSARRIRLKPGLLGGEVRHWSFAEMSGVAIWHSGQKPVGLKLIELFIGNSPDDVYQAGVVLSGGQPIALLEIPAKSQDRVAGILTEVTGLGIIQIEQ
jgi:hypothetical protein